jgi:hypothetical protein
MPTPESKRKAKSGPIDLFGLFSSAKPATSPTVQEIDAFFEASTISVGRLTGAVTIVGRSNQGVSEIDVGGAFFGNCLVFYFKI